MESRSPHPSESSGSWVLLGDVTSPFQADVLASALEEASIQFLAQPAGYFETAGRGALRFLVQPGDYDTASEILEELEELEQAPLEDEAVGPFDEVVRAPDLEVRAPTFDLADPDAVCFCPSCGMGYRAGFSRCADCEEILVSRSQVEDWLRE
jgi:hypothetical protein